jgi:riboflavin biosynthesis pyrimidine reductase
MCGKQQVTAADDSMAGMRRLLPTPLDDITPIDAYRDPNRRRDGSGHPWVGLCMVASVDGATVVDGRSGALSSPADFQVLLALRQLADVIVVGASTVRAERYGPPRKAGQRLGVVTRGATALDWDSALFTSGAGFVITTESASDVPVDSVRAGKDELDLPAALSQLDATYVHAEGGPRLNGSLFAAGLVREVNVTTAPRLVGGDGQRLVVGAPAAPTDFDLAHLLEDGGSLFARYVRAGG